MEFNIFWVNKAMASVKRFAFMASEQDYYAYSIHRLKLKLGLMKWFKQPKSDEISPLLLEIGKHYNWSLRELRLHQPLCQEILKQPQALEYWLRKVGASPEVWKSLGVKLPDHTKIKKEKKKVDAQGRLF